jgi:hypothetical protein
MVMTTQPDEVKQRAPARGRRCARAVFCLLLALGTSTTATAAIPRALRDALTNKSARVRILGVTGVARSGDGEAPVLLQGMLADPDPSVRVAVVDGLVKLKNPAALGALRTLAGDGDATVRTAAARAVAALEKMVVVVDTGDVEDLSNKSVPGLLPLLQDGVEKALRDALGPTVVVRRGSVERGYGAVLKLRSLRRLVEGGNGAIEVKCDVTLVELPGKILRFTSSATASAGVDGALPKSMERELATDGINACAPSLAKDIGAYVQAHRPK